MRYLGTNRIQRNVVKQVSGKIQETMKFFCNDTRSKNTAFVISTIQQPFPDITLKTEPNSSNKNNTKKDQYSNFTAINWDAKKVWKNENMWKYVATERTPESGAWVLDFRLCPNHQDWRLGHVTARLNLIRWLYGAWKKRRDWNFFEHGGGRRKELISYEAQLPWWGVGPTHRSKLLIGP